MVPQLDGFGALAEMAFWRLTLAWDSMAWQERIDENEAYTPRTSTRLSKNVAPPPRSVTACEVV